MKNKTHIRKIAILGAGILSLNAMANLFFACGKHGDRKVYFANLENHAQVESPFKVEMKAEGLIVEPAVNGIKEGAGHFHIIIDGPLSPPGAPIAKNETHIHYGKGESEALLDLPVGEHTLALQFATGDHIPYEPPIVQLITIQVTKQKSADSVATVVDSAAAMTTPADSLTGAAGAVGLDSSKAVLVDSVKKPAVH